MPEIMTNREFAKWLSEGKGEYISGDEFVHSYVMTNFSYELELENGHVTPDIKIRGWNEKEFHAPYKEN